MYNLTGQSPALHKGAIWLLGYTSGPFPNALNSLNSMTGNKLKKTASVKIKIKTANVPTQSG